MHIFSLGVDRVTGAHLLCNGEFVVVYISRHDSGTTLGAAYDGTHAHHATANDEDDVDIRNHGTADSVEPHTHRFDEGTGTGCEQSCGNHLLPWQGDIFAHGSPALYAKGLIVLTGVHTPVTAGGALATVRVGVDGHSHTRLQALRHVFAYAHDSGAYLMAWYHWHSHHGVATTEGAQVATTKTHVLQLQEHLIIARLGLCQVDDLHHRRLTNLNCFHFFLCIYSLIFLI